MDICLYNHFHLAPKYRLNHKKESRYHVFSFNYLLYLIIIKIVNITKAVKLKVFILKIGLYLLLQVLIVGVDKAKWWMC